MTLLIPDKSGYFFFHIILRGRSECRLFLKNILKRCSKVSAFNEIIIIRFIKRKSLWRDKILLLDANRGTQRVLINASHFIRVLISLIFLINLYIYIKKNYSNIANKYQKQLKKKRKKGSEREPKSSNSKLSTSMMHSLPESKSVSRENTPRS